MNPSCVLSQSICFRSVPEVGRGRVSAPTIIFPVTPGVPALFLKFASPKPDGILIGDYSSITGRHQHSALSVERAGVPRVWLNPIESERLS